MALMSNSLHRNFHFPAHFRLTEFQILFHILVHTIKRRAIKFQAEYLDNDVFCTFWLLIVKRKLYCSTGIIYTLAISKYEFYDPCIDNADL